MIKNLAYLKLHLYLGIESVLWTLTDLVRARRMRHSQRMHDRYKPNSEPDQPEDGIKN